MNSSKEDGLKSSKEYGFDFFGINVIKVEFIDPKIDPLNSDSLTTLKILCPIISKKGEILSSIEINIPTKFSTS